MSEASAINEDLRNLSWEILITRDDLLRIAEKLPERTRERAHQTAGKLPPLCANVQRILKSLPAGAPLPEGTLKNLVGLRDSIVLTLKELEDLMKELRVIIGEEELRPMDIN
jgi:hypothetical protein